MKLRMPVFMAVLLAPLVALAAMHSLPRGLASVEIPDDWTVSKTADDLAAVSRDRELTIIIGDRRMTEPEPPIEPPEPRPFGQVDEFKPDGRPERLRFNGFRGYLQRGAGKVDGIAVTAERISLSHELRKFTIRGWAYARKGKYDLDRRQAVRTIVRSLRAVD